ncbi:jg17268 [Pararge aegeria aegeria]|uniref:Jg17268 protein n=2 Tax=Pararge aegeria TaxID=116150 RepID=A0A8S4QZ34_9NEOP|nr:jg17268 [Pararge aegeria aegeria]
MTTNPRSVNVALETSLLFQPGEQNNIAFLNKIRNFIDQIEKAITPVKAFLRSAVDKKNIFSKFLEKITHILLKYEDQDLEETAIILTNEVEKKLNDEEIFSENTKNAIMKILKEYCKVDAKLIRNNLNNALKGNEIIVTLLADKINSHFDENDYVKLEDLLHKTAKNVKSDNAKADKAKMGEIKKIVKEFLNILKDKFDSLDESIKNQTNKDIGNMLQFFDVSKIYINEDYKKHNSKKKAFKKYPKSNDFNENKTENIIVNKDVEIFVNSSKNAKNGTDKIVHGSTYINDTDFEKNKLGKDESTVSDG